MVEEANCKEEEDSLDLQAYDHESFDSCWMRWGARILDG
jgi:hypothetical protein